MKLFTATLQLKFLGYWHAGGSHSQGFHTQATVARDPAGLPYLPGRTVKGLLRDAVSQLAFVKRLPDTVGEQNPDTLCETLFGKTGAHPGYTHAGCIGVGNACLSEAVRLRLMPHPEDAKSTVSLKTQLKEQLYQVLYSTCINEQGIAQAHSLRALEVAVPMTLHAQLTCLPPTGEPPELLQYWPNLLRAALVFLNAAGSLRHRGLGRLQASLHGAEGL